MKLTPKIITARPGEWVDDAIAKALKAVAAPDTAFAYFCHNGVLVTVDKNSTAQTAQADWSARLGVLCDVAMAFDAAQQHKAQS